ncbi:MAG: hypothetical protein IPJ75_03810 [Ignavibacteriales bacterium]|nr:hypothetical protein [Ignavibacteriales bacterium]
MAESLQAYKDLIAFNEKTKSSPNNLSHLYTELTRLVLITSDNYQVAMDYLKKALMYNPDNSYSKTLLLQIEQKFDPKDGSIDELASNEHLLIDFQLEDQAPISKLIDIDIKEHNYTNLEILRNKLE